MRRFNFTLTELLIVIAIIGVIVSILLPFLAPFLGIPHEPVRYYDQWGNEVNPFYYGW